MVERDVNFSDAQNDVIEFGADQQPTAITPIEIAQATNDPVFVDPATGQDIQQPAPSGQTIGATVIQVAADNRAVLPEGASIENIVVEGDNLVLVQPDGTRIIIEGASLNVPTFLIGQVEVPSQVLIAALQANGINVAAGPDGTVAVVSAGSSGGDLSDGDGNIGEAAPARPTSTPSCTSRCLALAMTSLCAFLRLPMRAMSIRNSRTSLPVASLRKTCQRASRKVTTVLIPRP